MIFLKLHFGFTLAHDFFNRYSTAQRAFRKRLYNPFIFIWAVLCVSGVPNSFHFSEHAQ